MKKPARSRAATETPSEPAPSQPLPHASGAFRLAAATVFLISLAAYLATVAPTVTGEDSGELVPAAWTLGVPHPPGYPLWTVVAHLFTYLPIGDAAFRVNLCSAVLGSAACALLVFIAGMLDVGPAAAAGAGLLLGFSTTFWSQAVIAEVYTLTALTLELMAYCLLVWREKYSTAPAASDRWLYAGLFMMSLSLGAHDTVSLITLPLWLAILFCERHRLTPGRFGRMLGTYAAGLAIYLYLPLRAAAHPAMNWGDPETWDNFWAVVTRSQYPSVLHQDRNVHDFMGQMSALAHYFWTQWPAPITVVVAALAVVGVFLAWRARPGLIALFAVAFAILSVFFAGLLNFHLDLEGIHVAEVFFIPAWTIIVLFATRGLQAIPQHSVRAGLICLLSMGTLVGNFPLSTMHGNDVARRYGLDMLSTLPQNAMIFTSADYEAFPLMYLQIVEKLRPDVIALDEQRDVLKACQLAHVDVVDADSALSSLIRYGGHPVYFTRFHSGENFVCRPVGLLYEARPANEKNSTLDDHEIWSRYIMGTPQGPWLDDWSTASILANYDEARARAALARGDRDAARQDAASAAARLKGDPTEANQLGALLARGGDAEGALPYYESAAALRPDYLEANYNAITTLMQLGRWRDAQERYAAACRAGVKFGSLADGLEAELMRHAGNP